MSASEQIDQGQIEHGVSGIASETQKLGFARMFIRSTFVLLEFGEDC